MAAINSRRKSLWFGESEGSLPPLHESFPDASEATNDFWSMSRSFIYRRHVEPRVKHYSPRDRNHSLFHWNTLTYPELFVQIWMPSKRSASMIIGISMGFETCQILGHVWHILLHWKKNVQTEICGLGRDWRKNSWYPGQIIYGQISGRKRERIPSWRRGESEHMRNLNSTMHENCEEFSSFFPLTRNLRRPSRMHATNWKHQWLPLCLARSARIIRIVEMVSNPKRSIVNLHVFWKPVNRQDCVWKNHYRIIMKTI